MPIITSEPIRHYFSAPQNITIGDKLFKNISSIDTRHYIENGMEQSVSYLDTFGNAEFDVFEANGKVHYLGTYYKEPVTKTIDGKVYCNIMSESVNYKTGITRYDNFNKNSLPTIINVNREGKIVKKESRIAAAVKKAGNMLKKVFKAAEPGKAKFPLPA